MSDLYVTCTFNNETQSTDTHIRAASGVGSFNWRCVYKIKLPSNDTTFSFRVFDKDLLSPDDYISSASFSISNILEEAYETREPQKLYLGTKDLTKYASDSVSCYKIIDGEKLYDRFEIPLLAKGKKNVSFLLINLVIIAKTSGKFGAECGSTSKDNSRQTTGGFGKGRAEPVPILRGAKGQIPMVMEPPCAGVTTLRPSI
jgi:hypothetical protein